MKKTRREIINSISKHARNIEERMSKENEDQKDAEAIRFLSQAEKKRMDYYQKDKEERDRELDRKQNEVFKRMNMPEEVRPSYRRIYICPECDHDAVALDDSNGNIVSWCEKGHVCVFNSEYSTKVHKQIYNFNYGS